MPAINRKVLRLGVVMLGGAASPLIQAQHVHGEIDLGIVVEGAAMAVSLQSPLANVVGFEYEPETADEIELVRAAAVRMRSQADMFLLSGDAQCEAVEVTVEGPDYFTSLATDDHDDDEHHDDDGHDDHDDDDHDEHHDDDDHNDRDDHDDHDDHDEDTHNDVEASYLWNCENPERLQNITLQFTDWFADVDSVEVQLITPQGVQVLELDEGSNTVELGE